MTNELEKQFFNTFGIEPKKQCYYWDCPYSTGDVVKDTPINERDCNSCKNPNKEIYPQITNRILLESLVIMTRYTDIIEGFDSVQELKEFVLKDLMYSLTQPECDIVKQQVHTLFKEK